MKGLPLLALFGVCVVAFLFYGVVMGAVTGSGFDFGFAVAATVSVVVTAFSLDKVVGK